MRSTVAALAVFAACMLAAGCGTDEGGDGAGEAQRLTKEEYVEEADAICKEANDRIAALPEPQSTDQLAELGQQVIDIGQAELDRLRALRPPAADEATINGAYDLIEQQLGVAADLVDAARNGDLGQVQQLLDQGEQLNDQADQIARDYGFEECGSA
jgi:hypothetical protein